MPCRPRAAAHVQPSGPGGSPIAPPGPTRLSRLGKAVDATARFEEPRVALRSEHAERAERNHPGDAGDCADDRAHRGPGGGG